MPTLGTAKEFDENDGNKVACLISIHSQTAEKLQIDNMRQETNEIKTKNTLSNRIGNQIEEKKKKNKSNNEPQRDVLFVNEIFVQLINYFVQGALAMKQFLFSNAYDLLRV